MSKLLWTREGMETANIEDDKRDRAVFAFFNMLFSLNRVFCIEREDFDFNYSFGNVVESLFFSSWDAFHQVPSFRNISYNTFDFISNGFQHAFPLLVLDLNHPFATLMDSHKGYAGFDYRNHPEYLITNLEEWEKWDVFFYTSHPEEVDWNKCNDELGFLPNGCCINRILSDAIDEHLRSVHSLSGDKRSEKEFIIESRRAIFAMSRYHVDNSVNKALKPNAVSLAFHGEVMPSYPKGGVRQGYCLKIGERICSYNYYIHETKLSSDEQYLSGSQRCIYSITKNGRKQYISLDFEKGMFEFYNDKGEHLGEFHYDGSRNTAADPNHHLLSID